MKLIELVTNKARILLNVLGNSKAFTAHNLCRWVSRYSFISCRWSRWSTTNSFCSWFEKGFKHVQMFVCWLDLHLKCQERDTFNSCSLARLASLPSFCGPSSTCRFERVTGWVASWDYWASHYSRSAHTLENSSRAGFCPLHSRVGAWLATWPEFDHDAPAYSWTVL